MQSKLLQDLCFKINVIPKTVRVGCARGAPGAARFVSYDRMPFVTIKVAKQKRTVTLFDAPSDAEVVVYDCIDTYFEFKGKKYRSVSQTHNRVKDTEAFESMWMHNAVNAFTECLEQAGENMDRFREEADSWLKEQGWCK